jgi:hypothetical protein
MARRWQALATTRVPVADAGSEASMAGREPYNPEISAHVRVAWPPGADLELVRQAIHDAAIEAVKQVVARAERGGR